MATNPPNQDAAKQNEQNRLKQVAAEAAAAMLQNGMVVGLGSGSTARLLVAAIGERAKQGLQITGIPTSELTADLARGLGIPLSTLAEHPEVDLTIDGADEVERETLNLIKGGGGNQLREKIVAVASSRLIIIVDEGKIVDRLGTHARLPVEVAQFGWQATAKHLENLGAVPTLRLTPEGAPYVTDGGNYILDCAFSVLEPVKIAQQLDGVVGVIEHGLFIGMTSLVLVGTNSGTRRLQRPV